MMSYVTSIVRFEDLTAVDVSWNGTSYRVGPVFRRNLLPPTSGPNIMIGRIRSCTLKMEAAGAFETLVLNYQSARSYIAQDRNLIISIFGLY
jgi:hypothetical protein